MWAIKNIPGVVIADTAQIHPTAHVSIGSRIGQYVVIHERVHIGPDVSIWDGAVIGRAPQRPGREPERDSLQTFIGAGAVIGAGATIYSDVTIGANTLIGDGARIREGCRISHDCIVGSNCTFQNDVIMLPGSRVIDLSHITAGVEIGAGAFVSTGVLTMNDNSFAGNNGDGESTLRPPFIGDNASIGGGAILLPGVRIGKHAVVAAGAVVTRDVEEGSTVAGIPAKRMYPRPRHPEDDL